MQVRAARTRQALIHAAAELIDDRGMKGTGLLDISRAAGVSKGALYFHFASKDELVAAVRQEARRSVVTLADQCMDGRSSTLAGAARFTSAMSRCMREDPVLRAGLRMESEGVFGERTGGGSLREEWLAVLRDRLTADAEAGRLRNDAGALATANLVAAVTVGLEALGRTDEKWWNPDVTAGIWQLLLGLAATDDRSASEVAAALAAAADDGDTPIGGPVTVDAAFGGGMTEEDEETTGVPAEAAFVRAEPSVPAPLPRQGSTSQGVLRVAGSHQKRAVRAPHAVPADSAAASSGALAAASYDRR